MKTWTTKQLLILMAGAALVATAVGAGLRKPPPGADITLPDSPLYNIAVTESIKGLNGEKKEAAGQPCPDCGEVHAQPAPDVAQSAGGQSQNFEYCENCKTYHRKAVTMQIGNEAAQPGIPNLVSNPDPPASP